MVSCSFYICLVILAGAYCEFQNGLDVDILCDLNGMTIRIIFDAPFQGVIFSKGFYKDSECVYIQTKEDIQMATFDIATGSCGTVARKDINDTRIILNTIVVQTDFFIHTISDSEVNLHCEIGNDSKRLTSSVKKFDNSSYERDEYEIEAWMEIMFQNNVIGRVPRLGDRLVVKVFVKDRMHSDARITNCIAHDEISDGYEVILLDDKGHLLKPTLFSTFNVSTSSSTDADIVAAADMVAFQFSDKNTVFITCNIELCKQQCYNGSNNLLKMKRSIEDSKPSQSNKRITDLMRQTIEAFHTGLGMSRSQNNLQRRNSNLMEQELENIESTETSITSRNNMDLTENTPDDPLKFNVTAFVTVLSPLSGNEGLKSTYCFSKLRFNLVATFFGLVCTCLLCTCLCLIVFIRNQKERSKISSFLLYSYE